MTLTKLTNEYGGSMQFCPTHLEPKRKHLGGTITESNVEGECADCVAEQRLAAAPQVMLDFILNDPAFSHTRYRNFFGGLGNGYVTAYRRDPSSPSGVFSYCSLDEARFNELVYPNVRHRAGGSPLSPTEGR